MRQIKQTKIFLVGFQMFWSSYRR